MMVGESKAGTGLQDKGLKGASLIITKEALQRCVNSDIQKEWTWLTLGKDEPFIKKFCAWGVLPKQAA